MELPSERSTFFNNFFNTDVLLGTRVSKEVLRASWNLAAGASATASLACVEQRQSKVA